MKLIKRTRVVLLLVRLLESMFEGACACVGVCARVGVCNYRMELCMRCTKEGARMCASIAAQIFMLADPLLFQISPLT